MKDGRFDDAARDYGASYELSQDPALFYKIGQAHQRAGRCDTALIYYARYLREGKPGDQFAALTRERIAACGGDPAPAAGTAGSGDTSGAPSTDAGGSSGAANAGGAGAADAATSGSRISGSSSPAPGPAGAAAATPGVASATAAAGATTPPAPGSAALIPPTREKIAWLLGGGAIALATLGGVLAYAASSSESDVRDLYAGLAGQIPTYDGATRKRYADLVDQGERYQHLSWAAFGLAGAATVGAVLLFTIGRDERPARAAVTPVVGPRSAGVSVRF
jgi:hypothetical protein